MISTEKSDGSSLKLSREIVKKLSRSKIYRDYEKAFNEATGLPLAIRPMETFQVALNGKKNESLFCALMVDSNKSCSQCLQIQAKLEEEAQIKPKTLKCFAGLCDSVAPIRVGDNLIAFLQSGQVLLHQPNRQEFNKITRKLISWGTKVDLKRLEEAYFQSNVLSPKQYEAFIHLLSTFAEHLAAISNELIVEKENAEPEMIIKARHFISDHYDEPLSLGEAAQAVNTSVHYFCKMFKQSTGITFTDYLTRIRIEKAKNLLLNPNRRISEVAYEVGFESLSQFNRSFKRITGRSPTEFRKQQN